MSRVLQLGLGVVTAIGGFVDIGNLVTSGITGARFGASLTWAIVVGTIGMTVYAVPGAVSDRVLADTPVRMADLRRPAGNRRLPHPPSAGRSTHRGPPPRG